MCNINVVFKKAGQDVVQQISDMTAVSWTTNSDGEGAFFSSDNTVIRQPGKRIDVKAYADKIEASEMVIFHERLATSGGKTIESTHPFFNERFVMVHNGIFWGASGFKVWEKKSDSAVFFQNFCDSFETSKDIKKAIEAALKKTGNGSYSIMLYDKQEKLAYYFKNQSTDMTAFHTKNGCVVFTTNPKNEMFWDVDTSKVVYPSWDVLLRIRKSGNSHVIETLGDLNTGAWADFKPRTVQDCNTCEPETSSKYNYNPKINNVARIKYAKPYSQKGCYGKDYQDNFWPDYDKSSFKMFVDMLGVAAYLMIWMVAFIFIIAMNILTEMDRAIFPMGGKNDTEFAKPADQKGAGAPVAGPAVLQQRN